MKPDAIKEELQWLRTVFPVLAAAVAAPIAYLVQGAASRTMLVLADSAVIAGVLVIVAVIRRIYRLLRLL